jgi:phosphomannomutase
MVAVMGKKIGALIDDMHQEFGHYYSKRVDLKLTPQLRDSVAAKLANPPEVVDGMEVRDVNTTDGVKLIFNEQTWLLFRLSGTEPVARVYAEACSPKDLKHVIDAGRKFVTPSAA